MSTIIEPQDQIVDVDGFKMHYLDWGNEDKPPMLLLHGRTQLAHSWDFTALAFHEDFHVIAMDQRGHGDSDWSSDGDYSLNNHIPDINAFVEALGLRSIRLIGHSMGGRNSMVYTSLHPTRIETLVLVDIAPLEDRPEGGAMSGAWQRLPQEADSFEEFVQAAHEVNPRRTLEQLRGSLGHQLRQFPNGKWSWKWDPALRDADTIGWNVDRLWECAAKIRCPTLLIRGGDSGLVSDATVQRMMDSIPGMTAAVIPGAGHLVPGDRPALFQDEVRKFISTVG